MARTDQAEGLRRLLDRSGLRIASISSGAGSRGTATAIVNLAGALVEFGSDVLILDGQAQGVAAALGLAERFDMEDVIHGGRALEDVIVRGPAGIAILPLARGARALSRLTPSAQRLLIEQCSRLSFPVDTLLVNAVPGSAGALSWPGTSVQEVIVIGGASPAAITAAYALIKRMNSEFARREFHILINDVAGEAEARTIFRNMQATARRYLRVSLEFMGHVPPDDKLQHAARLKLPVVAAFPGAAAARSFRNLARTAAGWPCADQDGCGFDELMRRLIFSNGPRAVAA